MRIRTAVLSAAMVFGVAAMAHAQERPDLAGTWTLDVAKTEAENPNMPGGMGAMVRGGGGGGGGGGAMRGGTMGGMMGGSEFTLTLDGNTLTRTGAGMGGGTQTQTYTLDGTPQNVGMGQMSATARAHWDGSALVIETTRDSPMGAVTTRAVYTREGEWLVITNTVNLPQGQMEFRQFYTR